MAAIRQRQCSSRKSCTLKASIGVGNSRLNTSRCRLVLTPLFHTWSSCQYQMPIFESSLRLRCLQPL